MSESYRMYTRRPDDEAVSRLVVRDADAHAPAEFTGTRLRQ